MKRALLALTLLTPVCALAQGFEGAYAGLYSGYAWAKDEGTSYNQATGQKNGWAQESNPRAVQYGALAGYNWLQPGQWLLGIEADLDGRADGSDSTYQQFNGVADPRYSLTTEIDYSATLRARAGYLPSPELLLFVSAGYAYAQVEREWQDSQNGNSSANRSGQDGWTAGLGAEYLLSAQISARIEYRYTDYGTRDDIPVNMWNEHYDQDLTEQSLRLGASYHF